MGVMLAPPLFPYVQLTDPGLSHTRPTPPSIEELRSDALRQTRLNPMVAAINERERIERIRQGYASEGDRRLEIHSHSAEYEKLYGAGPAGPSTARVESRAVRARQLPQPETRATTSVEGSGSRTDAGTRTRHGDRFQQRAESNIRQTYPVPTPPSPGLPPPTSVDPARHSTKEDLRRLSEEDTKRRMAEAGVPEHSERPVTQPAGALTPRRRGPALGSS